ncbi:hypothetical protein FE257_003592 [Aspergillus nanangensis]|uniref:Zn(2)-C6 fungal-type domain-containing protein n=1 Tax=Aspergillus nanangensis TaxID=2582783 RepID=A0AAD4GW84_ASPNN|nr:hypothetical protein FE257_003592 [Aspergillus nanangensis]
MPGVPSGRGCDACRQQKKKVESPTQHARCNLAIPACVRCARLGIKCFGGGQRRYKFINHTATGLTPLRIIPSSSTTLIAGHLVSRLEVKDIRYDTNCFGPFLQLIPQRIGANRALDIAADTFATVYSNLYVEKHPVQGLVKHGQALAALRDCLKAPQKGQVAEIASAIYLTMLNDDLISSRTNRPRVSHIEILVYLLQMTAHWNWESPFELQALLTITGVVIMESVGNHQLNLEPWVWKVLEKIEGPNSVRPKPDDAEAASRDPERFPSLELRRIIKIAQLIREPVDRCADLQSAYTLLLSDREKLKRQPKELFYSKDPSADQPRPQIQLGFQTRCATVLTLSLMVNLVLEEFSPLDTSLLAERDLLIEESIAVCQIPDRYKPLGACYVTPCLIVACAASRDPKRRAVIASLLGEISGCDGTPTTVWVDGVHGWRTRWESLRRQVPGRPLLSAAICRHAV